MGSTRLEAFSDGVIAILITIMVLDLRPPPISESLNSLVPFTTAWMGENHFAAAPSALYGVVLFMAAIAFWILQQRIIASQGPQSLLREGVGRDWKGKLSPVFYLIAIPSAFVSHWIAAALYLLVALLWLVPDRRIERVIQG